MDDTRHLESQMFDRRFRRVDKSLNVLHLEFLILKPSHHNKQRLKYEIVTLSGQTNSRQP